MNEKKAQKTDNLLKNYPNLKKFDEYYKDDKNIKKLNIFYKKPNVDQKSCQIDFNEFDKKYNLNNYSQKKDEENNININSNNIIKKLNVTKKYDFDKLSKDDLNYYLTLVNYYHENIYGGNIFVKGVNGPIEKALDLLKQCKYNTRLALAKILFPVMDRMGGLSEFQNPSLIIPQAMDSKSDVNDKKMEIEEEKKNDINEKMKENEVKKNIKINNELVNKQKRLLKNSPSIYLSFALSDLIGADKVQKEKWLQYIIEQVNNKVEFKNLKTLIEIANKMRLDLPDYIMKEINNSETLSNKIKKYLENKDQNLDELKELYNIAITQKVQTEEFNNLKKIIDQGYLWEEKVINIKDKCVEFKELESLFNEGKNFPFLIDPELNNSLTDRYTKAKLWLDLYSSLLKYSKNKSNTNKLSYELKSENSLNLIEKMIKTSNEVLNFTSPEVRLLIKNYNYLNETEKEIKSILYEPNKIITKEMLKGFLSKLNESKFTTELYDEIEERLNILEWRENINEHINSNRNDSNKIEGEDTINENNINEIFGIKKKIILKNKVFKFLIKEAESKKLLNYPDVKAFIDNDKIMTEWIKKIEPIFCYDKERENISSKMLLKELHNLDYSLKFEDFLKYYEEGQKFTLINEECEELLNNCKDIKDLYDEINLSLNDNQSILDFNKLKSFCDRIGQYNIICDKFDNVLKKLNIGQEWLENAKKFCIEYSNANENKFNFHYYKKNINNNIENNNIDYINNFNKNENYYMNNEEIDSQEFMKLRNENIKLIEKYLKENKIFFEELTNLTENVPSYLKNTIESNELSKYKCLAEVKMNKELELDTAEEILFYIEETQGICIKKETIKDYFNSYKIKTWNQAIKLKLYLENAESLLKESESLLKIQTNEIIRERINDIDIQDLNYKVNITKEWINKTKQFLLKKDKTVSELMNRTKEGEELPLLSSKALNLIEFKNLIENNINEIKKIKNEKTNFNIIAKLYKNFNDNKFIDNNEYIFIKSLYDFGIKWTENAKKIINSRQLCQLYFKNKVPLEDGTIIESKERKEIPLNMSNNKKNENNNNIINDDSLIFGGQNIKSNKFILGENHFMSDNLTNLISRKRNPENPNNLNNENNNQNDFNENKRRNSDKEEQKLGNLSIERNNSSLKGINISDNIINLEENNIEKNNEEKNNINSKTDNEYEYHQSETVKKYYLNQPLKEYECANLLSLINNKESFSIPPLSKNESNNSKLNYYTRSHSLSQNNNKKPENINIANNNQNNTNNNQKIELSEEQQVSPEQIQSFISMDYYHRYMYLRSNLIFHDDTNEEYCICRKGDDSVNYMIICEKCKEWFHGKCLGMPKSVADKISNYYCLCCTRKFDLPKEYYHKQFFEIKRVCLKDLILMIEEGNKVNCFFEEMEILEDIKCRSEVWNKRYYKLLDEVTEYYKKNDFLSEELEKRLEVIYLESEAIQIELSTFLHPIIILKQNEWFKNVYKEIKSNKHNEENVKNYIKLSYSIFNLNDKNHIIIPKLEENYYKRIYQLAELKLEILFGIYEIMKKK